MDSVFSNLRSPSWWFTVVAVSLVINIAAAYLKVWLDKKVTRFSTTRRQIAEQRRQDELAQLSRLRKSQMEQLLAGHEEVVHYQWAAILTLFGVLVMGVGITLTPILRNWTPPGIPPLSVQFPGWVSELFVAVYMFLVVVFENFAFRELRSAIHLTRLIREARKPEKSNS